MNHRLGHAALLALTLAGVFATSGCGRKLVKTPYVLAHEGPAAFDATHEDFKIPDMPIAYVTDRRRKGQDDRGAIYADGRSRDMFYGIATVSLSPEPSWDKLVRDSTTVQRLVQYRPSVSNIEPAGQITYLGNRLEIRDGQLVRTEEAMQEAIEEGQKLNDMLQPWIDRGMNEVIIYVHGVGNSFDSAVTRTAEIWHFTGRRAIPICYSWPSVSKLGLLAYTRDRESSEFTVLHLKVLLYALSLNPGIERVKIVAHSRGTDITSNVLRELYLEFERGGQEDVSDRFKLHTVVLAAPDIDNEVFQQRFFAENAGLAPDRLTIYFSPRDSAIGIASWLFSSGQRIGNIDPDTIGERGRELLPQVQSLELVECLVTRTSSHSYIFEHPGAFSDLILLLRDDASAYEDPDKRPLLSPFPGVWQLTDDYLRPGAPVAGSPPPPPRVHP